MAEFQGIIKSKTKCEPSVFYKNLKIKPLSCLPLTIWLKRSLVNCKKAINISICPIYGFKSSAISHLKFDTLSLVNRLFHKKDHHYVSNNIGAYKNAIWTKIISVNGKKMLKRALKHKLLVGEMVTISANNFTPYRILKCTNILAYMFMVFSMKQMIYK